MFSKAVRRYDRCACSTSKRYLNAPSASQEESTNDVKMSFGSQVKAMSVSQWKLLSHLKDYINKSGSDRGTLTLLNKEWISFLHKISSARAPDVNDGKNESQDSRLGSDAVKDRNNKAAFVDDMAQPLQKSQQASHTDVEEKPEPKEAPGYFPQVLSGLKQKMSNKPVPEAVEEVSQKWKQKKGFVSVTGVSSRTRHVISSLASAESASSQLTRLENLTNHLHQYPESRYLAVKEGAIRLLLKLRKNTQDAEIKAVLREALTVLGYVDPPPGNGLRILAIDGGGMRGLVVMEMLKKLEMLTGKRYYELFDLICGVSTGALMLSVIAGQKKPLDEVAQIYKEMSKKIFNQSAFWGTSNLVWSHSYYSTEMWEELLKTYIGDMDMIKTARDPEVPKIAAVSAVVNQARVMAFVFRNYSLPFSVQSQYMGSNQYKMWQAARASAAAPSYFEEFRLGEYLHQDGGIMTNNPTAVAIHEAKQLWSGRSLQCVLSLGTGRTHPSAVTLEDNASSASSWRTKFLKILDSATDREAVHTVLNDLLPPNVYYRFNPFLTELIGMDETRPEKISQLEMDAEMFFRRNEDIFREVAKALTKRASFTQQIKNWINLQRELVEFK